MFQHLKLLDNLLVLKLWQHLKAFQVPGSNPVQGWHLLSRNPHQDYLSNGSDGQINQDLAKQHHQLREQVVQVSFITSNLLYGYESADSEKRIQAFEKRVLEDTFSHLLLGVQDQRLVAEQDQLPCGST